MRLFDKARRIGACFTALLCLLLSQAALAALDLNGIASHSEYGKEQFLAALYLEDLSSDPKKILLSNQRKRMEIKVVADKLFSRKFKSQWIEGVAINAGNIDLKAHAQNLADFSNMLSIKLIKNDTLMIERTFRRGVEVSMNGVLLGTIADEKFFDLILRAWIGPVPLSTDFKTDLLASGSINPELLARFEDIRTTRERVAAINTGIINKAEAAAIALADTEGTNLADGAASSSGAAASDGQGSSTTTSADLAKASESASSSSVALAAIAPNPITNDEDVFEDEEEDFSYTAADLLSRQLYLSKLTRWTGSYVKYPNSSLRKNEQGTVRVSVTINRTGKVIASEIIKESEHKSLNKEALKAVGRASPYPAMPDVITGETFEFTLPVVFSIRTE